MVKLSREARKLTVTRTKIMVPSGPKGGAELGRDVRGFLGLWRCLFLDVGCAYRYFLEIMYSIGRKCFM